MKSLQVWYSEGSISNYTFNKCIGDKQKFVILFISRHGVEMAFNPEDVSKDFQKLEEENEDLKSKIQEMEEKNSSLEKELSDAIIRHVNLFSKNAELFMEIDNLKEKIVELEYYKKRWLETEEVLSEKVAEIQKINDDNDFRAAEVRQYDYEQNRKLSAEVDELSKDRYLEAAKVKKLEEKLKVSEDENKKLKNDISLYQRSWSLPIGECIFRCTDCSAMKTTEMLCGCGTMTCKGCCGK